MEPEFSVSEFVAVFNQTLEYAYPSVTVKGELANFKVSKNRWVYFDLKDETSTVRFFGNVYQLPGPLEDGMMLAVRGTPRLHQQFGFSVNIISMRATGEGSIKKAAELLRVKLAGEGLFDIERKRQLPYPPSHIGLITSAESAAYRDFVKVIGSRWGGIDISLIDVRVQGEVAPAQLVAAIDQFNESGEPPEVLVITRGGGSAEDLQAFSTEQVTRAVAASRIPTMVAIGHEIDLSLAEMAADQRGSTPSNAAELLVPDRRAVISVLKQHNRELDQLVRHALADAKTNLKFSRHQLHDHAARVLLNANEQIKLKRQVLAAFDPNTALKRGYALVRLNGKLVASGRQIKTKDEIDIQLADANVLASVKQVTMKP